MGQRYQNFLEPSISRDDAAQQQMPLLVQQCFHYANILRLPPRWKKPRRPSNVEGGTTDGSIALIARLQTALKNKETGNWGAFIAPSKYLDSEIITLTRRLLLAAPAAPRPSTAVHVGRCYTYRFVFL
jgi:hypothetical protein